MFAEDPGGVAHLAYHKEAGRVSGVVEEHPGGAVHPDHDHGTVQVVGVVAEEPGDVHQGAGLHSYIRVPTLGNRISRCSLEVYTTRLSPRSWPGGRGS